MLLSHTFNTQPWKDMHHLQIQSTNTYFTNIWKQAFFFFTDLLKFTCRTFKKVIMEQNKELIIIFESKNLKLRP